MMVTTRYRVDISKVKKNSLIIKKKIMIKNFLQKNVQFQKKSLTLKRFYTRNLNLIEDTIRGRLAVRAFEIQDESASHMEADDSHFRIYVVSDDFEGLTLIKR